MKKISIFHISIIFFFSLVSIDTFSQEENNNIENTIKYFIQRTEAIDLAKNSDWEKLLPVAENLTLMYQKDGDLFYLLGLAYYQTEQYQKAIAAFEKTLDCGGTILNGVPTGSAPSNDIMIKIAKAYALDNDKVNALIWLQKGFASRYDEKPFLKDDNAFKAFNKDYDFLQIFGYKNQTNLNREEMWVSDLDYLKQRITELHYNPFHSMSETDYNESMIELKTKINSLSDEHLIVEVMKILGRLNNGHNLIIPTSSKNASLQRLPVQFYQFDDGIFIVNAEEDYKHWIGYKVESIGDTQIEEALQKTNAVNARDNDMQTLWLGPYYLGLPDVLEGLGIIKNKDQIVITVVNAEGKAQKLTMNSINWKFAGFPKLPKRHVGPQPLFLSKVNDPIGLS